MCWKGCSTFLKKGSIYFIENPEIPSFTLAQEGSVSAHSNIQLVKSELVLLSVVVGEATVILLTSVEYLWIDSDVSRS